MLGQTEWLERHAHQKNSNAEPQPLQSFVRDLIARNDEDTIKENLARDQKRGTYTFFDYMNAAMKLPTEVLVTVTGMPEYKRREFVRYVGHDVDRPTPRIWKKVKFADSTGDT